MSEAGSGIEGMRNDSAFARLVASRLTAETFKLVDIGCAGGLPPGWRTFGDRLAALGFDCDADEIARLNANERNPLISYVSGWAGLPQGHPLREHMGRRYDDRAYWHMWVDKRLSYERTQDIRQAKATGTPLRSIEDYFREDVLGQTWTPFPLSGFDVDYSRAYETLAPTQAQIDAALADPRPDREIYLPAYLAASGFSDADFIKIDVDGPDFDLLRSLNSVLERPSLLGVAAEVCFYGSHDANDNSFHNVDRLMRQKGFDLFALSVRKYASAALPVRYMDVHPSMTVEGRPVQGDAIYLRDLSSRAREAEARAVSNEKLAKSAALFSLFNLSDYAAEILTVHRGRLAQVLDVDQALDVLAVEVQPYEQQILDYRPYIAEFEADGDRFYDEYGKKNAWHQRILRLANTAPGERDAALEKLQDAEQQMHLLQERSVAEAEGLRRRAETAEARLAELQRSILWRAANPLRRLAATWRGRA